MSHSIVHSVADWDHAPILMPSGENVGQGDACRGRRDLLDSVLVHVKTTTVRQVKRTYRYLSLVESWGEDGKMRQCTVARLGEDSTLAASSAGSLPRCPRSHVAPGWTRIRPPISFVTTGPLSKSSGVSES